MARSRWLGEVEQLGRLVDEPGGVVAGEELGMLDHVEQEGQVGLHAADAELAAAPGPCARIASSAVGAQAVTFTSSES